MQVTTGPESSLNAFVRIPFSTEAFNQYGLALSGEVGLPHEAYATPSPQQTINDAFAVFWPQTGVMQAPSPAPGAQAVPYLSIGNSGGPVDPVTGAPAATGTTQGTGSLPSWAVPGLGSGSDGTGKQGLLDSSSGTNVAANTPADQAASGTATQVGGADTTITSAGGEDATVTQAGSGDATVTQAGSGDTAVTQANGADPAVTQPSGQDATQVASANQPASGDSQDSGVSQDNSVSQGDASQSSSQMVTMADPTGPTTG